MKPKPKPTCKFKNYSQKCVQLSYTIQHRTGLIILRPNLHTIIIAQMLSIGGVREQADLTT